MTDSKNKSEIQNSLWFRFITEVENKSKNFFMWILNQFFYIINFVFTLKPLKDESYLKIFQMIIFFIIVGLVLLRGNYNDEYESLKNLNFNDDNKLIILLLFFILFMLVSIKIESKYVLVLLFIFHILNDKLKN